MNNKGFTLVEVLTAITIISLVSFIVLKQIGDTLSITKNESYKLMKNNIIKAAENYINECNNNIIVCNINWNDNKIKFYASILKDNGYFNNLNSPIDDKNLGDCLIINATRKNSVINVSLEDNCY